jgi:hypothetical protein
MNLFSAIGSAMGMKEDVGATDPVGQNPVSN